MQYTAQFSVDTRLTRLLGETSRSSDVALKELIDNAWDADAPNVRITLPTPLTDEAVDAIFFRWGNSNHRSPVAAQ